MDWNPCKTYACQHGFVMRCRKHWQAPKRPKTEPNHYIDAPNLYKHQHKNEYSSNYARVNPYLLRICFSFLWCLCRFGFDYFFWLCRFCSDLARHLHNLQAPTQTSKKQDSTFIRPIALLLLIASVLGMAIATATWLQAMNLQGSTNKLKASKIFNYNPYFIYLLQLICLFER